MLTVLQALADAAGLICWMSAWTPRSPGRTSTRPAPGKEGDLQAEPPGGVRTEPADHALGRSRGGLTTKLHLGCEQGQRPLSIVLTAGQRGDSPQFGVVLDGIRVPRLHRGRPRTRPDRVLADKAYTSRANRRDLRRRGIKATIPSKADQDAARRKLRSNGGRPPAFEDPVPSLRRGRVGRHGHESDRNRTPGGLRGWTCVAGGAGPAR